MMVVLYRYSCLFVPLSVRHHPDCCCCWWGSTLKPIPKKKTNSNNNSRAEVKVEMGKSSSCVRPRSLSRRAASTTNHHQPVEDGNNAIPLSANCVQKTPTSSRAAAGKSTIEPFASVRPLLVVVADCDYWKESIPGQPDTITSRDETRKQIFKKLHLEWPRRRRRGDRKRMQRNCNRVTREQWETNYFFLSQHQF